MIDTVCYRSEWSVATSTQGKRERNRQRWFERIQAWERSGLTQRAFIDQRQLNAASFQRWKRIFRSASKNSATTVVNSGIATLVPVEVLQQGAAVDSGVVLELEGAVRIHLKSAFDAATLQRVLQTLGEDRARR